MDSLRLMMRRGGHQQAAGVTSNPHAYIIAQRGAGGCFRGREICKLPFAPLKKMGDDSRKKESLLSLHLETLLLFFLFALSSSVSPDEA